KLWSRRSRNGCGRASVRTGLGVRLPDFFRLRGTLLAEKDREHDEHADGEELALPVLKRLEPELGAPGVLDNPKGRLPVEASLRAFLRPPGHRVARHRSNEQQREGDRQGVLVEAESPSAAP